MTVRPVLHLILATGLAGPLTAGTRHLFLDPAFVATADNAMLRVNPPLRRDLVMRPDRPWEKYFIAFYITVLDQGEELRMWYAVRDTPKSGGLAYAESTDGLHWTKPDLGLVEFAGSKANNLVGLPNIEGNVFRDPHAKAEAERYVYVSTVFRGGGIYRFTSPDGFRWQRDPAPLVPFEADSQNITFWDERLGKYVFFFRGWNISTPFGLGRKIVRYEADRLDRPFGLVSTGKGRAFKNDPARDPLIVDEMPTVLACDDRDPPNTDIYTNAIQPYPPAPAWYVGFPAFYRHATKSAHRNDGRTEVQFIASHDGRSWQRYDRATYVGPGFAGSESANMVYLSPGLVIRGDEIWQFGTGYRSTHGDVAAREARTDGAIYRYVQRLDGFVSLDFAAGGGQAMTAPVTIDGPTLRLNLDPGALGELRVALLDADSGRALSGFATPDCDPLQTNATGALVTWRGHSDLAAWQGRHIRLTLTGTRTKLFSFRFE
jgi:hypothetical protein